MSDALGVGASMWSLASGVPSASTSFSCAYFGATVVCMNKSVAMINPDNLVDRPAFSHVAVVPPNATTIYVGGQNAVDAQGNLVGGSDIVAQTKQVMTNLRLALESAGASISDIIRWSILVVAGSDFEAAAAVAAKSLDPESHPPLISVARVAGLAVPGALIEVSAVASLTR